MAGATAVFTQSPYPKGQDMTQRRLILHGPVVISASPATYLNGGIPITNGTPGIAVPIGVGVSKPNPVTVDFASRSGGGYIYQWIGVDLWTALYKGNAVALGQSLIDTNGNIQTCTTIGTAGSGSEPAWNQTVGGTTADGSGALIWTNKGISLGLIQILQQNSTTGPLIEIANGTTIAAGISGDTIAAQIEFLKG